MYDLNEFYSFSEQEYYWGVAYEILSGDGCGKGYCWTWIPAMDEAEGNNGIGDSFNSSETNFTCSNIPVGNGYGSYHWPGGTLADSELVLWYITKSEYVLRRLK